MKKNFDSGKRKHRINMLIRCSTVRLFKDNIPMGVVPLANALKLAEECNLDLVELVANANPPVCHILKYDKYLYEQEKKEKEAKQSQKVNAMKEIRLSPNIQDHDIETKVNTLKRFLEEDRKVQIVLKYKSRQNSHKEEGFKVINKIVESIKDVANIEHAPKLDGSRLICIVSPK